MARMRLFHVIRIIASNRSHILFQVFIFLFLIFLSSIVFLITGNLIILFGWDINLFTEMVSEEWLMQPENAKPMLMLQLIQHTGTFIVPPLIYARLVNLYPGTFLSINTKPSLWLCLSGGLIMLVSLPFINWLAEINGKLSLPGWMAVLESWMKESEEKTQKLAEILIRAENILQLPVNLFVIAIVPAVGEELVFRGIIQRHFLRMSVRPWTAIIVTAILFSALHMQFMTFLPRFFLGMILGYIFYLTNNIWISIFAHFVNNAFGVIAYYMMDRGLFSDDRFNPDTLGTGNEQIWITIGSFLSCMLLLMVFRKVHNGLKANKIHPEDE